MLCGSFFSTVFAQNILCCDKYLVNHGWDACRNGCRSSYEMSIIVVCSEHKIGNNQ
jgi:hypothetical protein